MKFATKAIRHYHLTLGTLLQYLGELKIQIYADIQQIWKKTQINCILSAPILIPLRMCFYQRLVFVAEYHVDCWKNTAAMSAVTNFRCHKLISKVNKLKNFIFNQYGEQLAILNTENINICVWVTKLEAINMQFVCIFSISAEYHLKIWICNFPR